MAFFLSVCLCSAMCGVYTKGRVSRVENMGRSILALDGDDVRCGVDWAVSWV